MAGWDLTWAYKFPFALQRIWPAIVLPILFFMPESPWLLVRKGRTDEALGALHRLGDGNDPRVDLDKTLAMMQRLCYMENRFKSAAPPGTVSREPLGTAQKF
jgi:SP family general alpha glucoside:H+ symporter-like MFS transporter